MLLRAYLDIDVQVGLIVHALVSNRLARVENAVAVHIFIQIILDYLAFNGLLLSLLSLLRFFMGSWSFLSSLSFLLLRVWTSLFGSRRCALLILLFLVPATSHDTVSYTHLRAHET